jgi:hypothetical protein
LAHTIARRPFRRLTLLVPALLLGGCVETGDFGRPRPSIWNDGLPFTGSLVAGVRGEAVSSNPFTNDERELRDRAFRYLMPAATPSAFEAALTNIVRTRFLPRDLLPADATAYYRALLAPSFRSPTSRYRQTSDDIYADRALLSPFHTLAGQVLSADLVRGKSMSHVVDLNSVERAEAVARMVENVGLIAWVREALAIRICQYHYAVEHLTVAAPQADAVPVERSLKALEHEFAMLERLDIGPLVGGEKQSQTGPWVRPLPACRAVVYALPDVVAVRPLVRKY